VVRIGGVKVLVARSYSSGNLVRLLPERVHPSLKINPSSVAQPWQTGLPHVLIEDSSMPGDAASEPAGGARNEEASRAGEINLFYLFACYAEWERSADPGAAWEIISATRSSHQDTRAHSLGLLERMQEPSMSLAEENRTARGSIQKESAVKVPYGLEVIESCTSCKACRGNYFCSFSPSVLRSADAASYHSVMPAGALLFVEGQSPRGVYILCSGKVKLSTTSKDGKVLILKQAEAGEVMGLSAAISGTNYEMTAETSSACQLNFIGRRDLMALLQNENEVGVHAAQALSREFQAAYRDIHDLVLARSSSGKLAKLLLSCAPRGMSEMEEQRVRSGMTHEEMAQRIGSSRETVTRLLSSLKKKRLIRIDGATLVIRDRTGLEALAM
jgi:CRP/FNR family cyclic AMP-dependent transcriptional regulator